MDEDKSRKEAEDARYALYLDERKLLIAAEHEGARTFDKAVLTLASGGFVFTMAFLRDLVPEPAQETLVWLWTCWLLFGLTLLASLLSFLVSQQACRTAIHRAETDLLGRQEDRAASQIRTRLTEWLNWSCVAFLVGGFVCWVVFVHQNLTQ